jgi:hypothetical protein
MDLELYRVNIYNKIIRQFTNKNIVVYNRSGEFYKINMPEYASGRDYGDAWIFGDDFHTHLYYNFTINSCSIYFHSLSKNIELGSTDFKKFIETIESNSNDLIYVEEDRKRNILDLIYNNSKLYFNNIVIDNKLIINLNNYFKNNKGITFNNCVIGPHINFTLLQNQDIIFSNMNIQDFGIFKNTNNDYTFNSCDISLEKQVNIQSEKLALINCNINYKKLFLISYAPNLQVLEIANIDTEDLNDNYNYLPDFAPNLEVISIDGKVTNMLFLTRLKNLQIIELKGFYNCFGMASPVVNNIKELGRLEEKNKEQVEIKKILKGYKNSEKLQNHDTCSLEVSRILRLCELHNRLSFTIDEEKNLKDIYSKYKNLYDYVNNPNFLELDKGYYEVINSKIKLNYDNLINPLKILLPYEDKFIIEKQFLGTYNSLSPIIKGKGILILHIDGRPIVFTNQKSFNIDTKEKALEFVKNFVQQEKVVEEDGTDYFVNSIMEELFNMENYHKDINNQFIEYDFVDFIDLCISEKACANPLNSPFNKPFLAKLKQLYGDQLSELYKCFDQYKERQIKEKSIVDKNKIAIEKVFELILKSDNLSKEDLLLLYNNIHILSLSSNHGDRFYNPSFIIKILNYFNIDIDLKSLTYNTCIEEDFINNFNTLEQQKKEWQEYLNNRSIPLSKQAIKQLSLVKKKI